MNAALEWLLAAAVVVVLPLAALLGSRAGRSAARSGVGAGLMAFGAFFDSSARHLAEVHEKQAEDEDDSGEPKDPESASKTGA